MLRSYKGALNSCLSGGGIEFVRVRYFVSIVKSLVPLLHMTATPSCV